MSKVDKSYFVWIKSVGGKIFPAKIFDHTYDTGTNKKQIEFISKHELNEAHANMSLDNLSLEFPLT